MTTTRAEQRRQTELRILAAARRLFGEHGYDRTTIRAIAAAADSDAGLVMRYFGSKEQLFAEVVADIMARPIILTPSTLKSATAAHEIAAQLDAAGALT